MGPDTPDAVIIATTTSAKKVIDETNDEKKDTDSPSPKKPKSTKKKKKKVATTKMKKKKSITDDDDDDDVDIIVATTSPSATTATTSSNTQSNNASPPKRSKSATLKIKYKPNKSAKSKISPSATDAATATATATATTSSDTQSDNASPPKRTKSAKLTRTKSIKSTKTKISPSATDAATATATATTSSDTQSDNASPPKRTKSAKLTRTKSIKSTKTKISPSATDADAAAATATATTSSGTQSDNASPPKRTKSAKSLTRTKSNKSTKSKVSPFADTATATTLSDTQSENASPPKRTKSAMSLTKTKLNKSTKSKISPSATDAVTATTLFDTQSNDASPPKRTPPKRTKSAMPLTKTKSSKSTKSKINRTKSLGGEDRKKHPPQRSLSSTGGRGRGWEGGRGRGPGRGRGRGRGRDPSLRGRGMHVSGNGEFSQRMKGGGRGINGGRSNRRFIDTNERGRSPQPARERGRSPQAAREGGRGPGRGQRPQSVRAGRSMEINSNGRQSSFRQNSTRSLRQSSTRSFDTSTHSSRGSGDSWLDEKNELHPEKTKSARNIYMAPAVDLYKDPSKPKSILRRSFHNSESNHRSMMPSSSHHARRVSSPGSVQKASGRAREENNELYSTDSGASFEDDDYEMYINDNGDDDRSFADEGDPDEKTQQEVSRNIIGSFVTKSLRSIGTMDSGLGTGSSHHNSSPRENDNFNRRSGLARSNPKQTQSTRSMLSLEVMEFQDENTCIRSLRYIRIMAPYPNEDPIKKKIRIFTWVALLLDFVNALVAIITYGGETTQCCGKSIMSAFGGTDYWDLIIKIITCGYMLLIFLEVFPVITGGFPFNLFNPFIGFMITFAVFFSDSMVEAVVMWTIEACAVFCEIYIYRLLLLRFTERKSRLKNTRNEITKLRKIKRKVKNQFENGMFSTRSDSSQDILNIDFSDEDSFADDDSFLDEMETQKNDNDDHTVVSRTTLVTAAEISTVRETRLLRERRKLILSQTEEERDLRYHFVGVCINTFLVVFSLLMIIIIAKNGGMCIKNMTFGNIFKNDQLDKCNLCVDVDGPCEICSYFEDGTTVTPESQCYYPYG